MEYEHFYLFNIYYLYFFMSLSVWCLLKASKLTYTNKSIADIH